MPGVPPRPAAEDRVRVRAGRLWRQAVPTRWKHNKRSVAPARPKPGGSACAAPGRASRHGHGDGSQAGSERQKSTRYSSLSIPPFALSDNFAPALTSAFTRVEDDLVFAGTKGGLPACRPMYL